MFNVTPIPAFSDNYIWVFPTADGACAVDPGEAAPLVAWLDAHGQTLAHVLVTHHHADHAGGLAELAARYPGLSVWGPAGVAGVNQPLMDGAAVEIGPLRFDVIATPGHTLDHLCYLGHGALFCGDTLFGAGCGRVFEGTPAMLHASLSRLAALPAATLAYPAHEYTLSNLRFALAVEPDNAAIATRIARDQARRQQGQPTLPTTLGEELASNPFLRTAQPGVSRAARQHAGGELIDDSAIFAQLRAWKNAFS